MGRTRPISGRWAYGLDSGRPSPAILSEWSQRLKRASNWLAKARTPQGTEPHQGTDGPSTPAGASKAREIWTQSAAPEAHERLSFPIPQSRSDDLGLPVVAADDWAVLQIQPIAQRPQSRPGRTDPAGPRPAAWSNMAWPNRRRGSIQTGYIWLFAINSCFLVRLLSDPLMVRRPLLESESVGRWHDVHRHGAADLFDGQRHQQQADGRRPDRRPQGPTGEPLGIDGRPRIGRWSATGRAIRCCICCRLFRRRCCLSTTRPRQTPQERDARATWCWWPRPVRWRSWATWPW